MHVSIHQGILLIYVFMLCAKKLNFTNQKKEKKRNN